MSDLKTIEDLSVAEVAALGDVVIVMREDGRSCASYIRGHKAPADWSVDYEHDDDAPRAIRRARVTVGWLSKVWKKSAVEDRRAIAEGSDGWRELHRA
jgi:hypothetical protein